MRCLYCESPVEPGVTYRINGLSDAVELRAVEIASDREVPMCLRHIVLTVMKFGGEHTVVPEKEKVPA